MFKIATLTDVHRINKKKVVHKSTRPSAFLAHISRKRKLSLAFLDVKIAGYVFINNRDLQKRKF